MSDDLAVPDPLPLRNIPVPAEVTRVEGCTCGGLELHAVQTNWWPPNPGCALWSLPHEEMQARVNAASGRLRAHTAELNARLRRAAPQLYPIATAPVPAKLA